MPERPLLLKLLLRERHWQNYATFCAEYDKAAARIDPDLAGSFPSRAQLHRWLTGSLRGLPYPDHCRVLEEMFPGWTAEQLFQPASPELLYARRQIPGPRPDAGTTGPARLRRALGRPAPVHRAGLHPRARHHRLRRILRRNPPRRDPGTPRQDPHRPEQARHPGHPAAAARHQPAHGPALPGRRPDRRPGLPGPRPPADRPPRPCHPGHRAGTRQPRPHRARRRLRSAPTPARRCSSSTSSTARKCSSASTRSPSTRSRCPAARATSTT